MQTMVHGYERNGKSQAPKVFESFKNLESTSTIHKLSFYCCFFIEKMTYNLVNLKYQNSLNIGRNANPTFYLMNNQSNHLKTSEALSKIPKNMFVA